MKLITRTSAPEKSDVPISRSPFPRSSQVSPPVGGARRRLQGWSRKKGLSGSFPFQRVPCLLAAPAGILGVHLHTFNSTCFSEQQLRPICSFFPLLQQALAPQSFPLQNQQHQQSRILCPGHRVTAPQGACIELRLNNQQSSAPSSDALTSTLQCPSSKLLSVKMSNLFPSLSVLTNSRKLQERLFFCLFSCHKEAYCSVTKLCLTLYDPMDCSMSGLSVLHHLPKFARTQVYLVSDAIQPSHPLLCLLIFWLQLPSTVTLEPNKIKFATVFTFPPSVCCF